MMSDLTGILERPKAYYNIDGVGELGIGVMASPMPCIGWMQVRSPETSVWNRPYMLLVFMGAVCLLIHYGSKAIKKHITYPRTGFVQYSRRDTVWRPMIISFAVSVVAAVVLFFAIRHHLSMTTPASLMGLVFAASYAYGFARTVRWKWMVVWVMIAGSIVIALLPADLIGSLADHSWITKVVSAKTVGAVELMHPALWCGAFDFRQRQLLALPAPYPAASGGRAMKPQVRKIAELDRTIHEPGRLMVMALLFAVEGCDFLYLQHETGMNKGTLSSHLSRLEAAGYIEVSKTYRGKVPQTLLRLTKTGRKAFEQYRRHLREAL